MLDVNSAFRANRQFLASTSSTSGFQAAQTFLSIVQERESALISAWFDDDLQSSQARLAALLQTAGA